MVKGKVNPAFNLIVSVMGNIAEMERETMLERQREGIALASGQRDLQRPGARFQGIKGGFLGQIPRSRQTP